MNKEEIKYTIKPSFTTRKLKELQQENKQLKERIEYLERSNNRREDEIMSLRDELIETPKERELEERIDKAIDKLTTEQLYTNFTWGKSFYSKLFKDLIEILKGDDK